MVEPGRPQMTIWRMCIACWVPKATNTHSEYVILIAFPLQQLLHEGASVLSYTYIACLVFCVSNTAFWDVKPCRLVVKYRRFRGKRYLTRYRLY